MADYKFSGLPGLATPASNDLVPIVDVDDSITPPAGSGGSNKAITVSGLTRILYPSGDSSGVLDAVAIMAAVTSAPSGPGYGTIIRLAPTAQWFIAGGNVVITRSGIFIDASGCFISAVGTGDTIRMYDATTWGSRTMFPGGGLLGMPVIDGTSATAPACAYHAGDILQLAAFVRAQNFTGSGSIGVHFDNANFWTEQCYGRVYAQNCTQHVVFDVSGATTSAGSYARANLDIYIEQNTASNDGVVLQNGALIYDSNVLIRGNFVPSGSSVSTGVLHVSGTVPAGHPAAGAFSQFINSQLDIAVEVASGAFTSSTIICGSASNSLSGNHGSMDFSLGTGSFTAAGANAIQALYLYNGVIFGDSGLATSCGWPQGHPMNIPGGIALGNFASSITVTSSSTISSNVGATRVTSSGAVTGVILQAGTYDGQMLWVINTGANSITFAASGTSHVADGVSDVLAAGSSRLYIYDKQVTALWYRAS